MLATLLVLSLLQSAPADAPRLDVPAHRALSLLAPTHAAPHAYRLLQDSDSDMDGGGSSFSVLRATGAFLAGFGTQLIIGSLMLAGEITAIFGVAIVVAAFTKGAGIELISRAGAIGSLVINGAILPFLGAIPVWLIANGLRGYSHSFLWTWLSGLATYATYWTIIASQPPRFGGFELFLWPVHVAGWFFTALVQSIVVHITREETGFASRTPSPALINVEGRRVALGAPLPVLVPDAARPGHMLPMVALAQGRF